MGAENGGGGAAGGLGGSEVNPWLGGAGTEIGLGGGWGALFEG